MVDFLMKVVMGAGAITYIAALFYTVYLVLITDLEPNAPRLIKQIYGYGQFNIIFWTILVLFLLLTKIGGFLIGT